MHKKPKFRPVTAPTKGGKPGKNYDGKAWNAWFTYSHIMVFIDFTQLMGYFHHFIYTNKVSSILTEEVYSFLGY